MEGKQTPIEAYISEVQSLFKTEQAREHAYRPSLKKLVEALNPDLQAVNDPKQSEHGAPDFALITRKLNLPIGYIETKDLDVSLDKVEKGEQMERYLGYSHLILTNYLEFRFYKNGKVYGESIAVAKLSSGVVIPIEANYRDLQNELLDFLSSPPEKIKSGVRLAKIMGGKARRIRDNVKRFLSAESEKNSELLRVYETVKKLLVHDITPEAFADMYAQTLVYGLFVARYHDETQKDFSRQEARDLVPVSNPFLQHFFDHIVGPNFDKRLGYIVNELCEIFSHANVQELMSEYFKKDDLWGKTHEGPDPVIHFYEDFLKEYDSDLRKKLGAFYTPLPVVRFIVRAVDHILEKEFGLSQGLADTTKLVDGKHRVQILDPAAGTGTFISATIRLIYEKLLKRGQKGSWPAYVHHDLLPRLHGFELMMAPYTIAHLKLSMAFKETGFSNFHRRLGIYLTNSLEEGEVQKDIFTGFGFAESIAEESKEAAAVKNKTPIMVVIGNPPYSVSSSNKGEWIQNFIKVYKAGLGERKINLDDDYIKFLRFAEHFIEKNRTGIVAMITNNSFIDGITHRQMRKHLLETFDEIYILDLHGNSKKKEKAPDGGKDENVFDIQQGVSINIFVRNNENKTGLGTVYYSEVFGKRESKFETLNKSDIEKVKWQKLTCVEPYFFFVPKDFESKKEYDSYVSLGDLFQTISSGVKNERDGVCIDFNKDVLEKRIVDFMTLSEQDIKTKYHLKDSRDWKVSYAKKDIITHSGQDLYRRTSYRPFDERWTYYTGTSRGFIGTPNPKGMAHMMKDNLLLVFTRLNRQASLSYFFLTKSLADIHLLDSAGDSLNTAPLYLFSDDGTRRPNFKTDVIKNIEGVVGKTTPEDILDYIYATLHSPSYRTKYKEFLKIDFPRVPYPKDKKQFNALVLLGRELRGIHLLESSKVSRFITTYPVSGSDAVEKIAYKGGKVYINSEQYFGDIPEVAWNFYIGGYQPAQKWLKDRKGHKLSNADIEHYQKIIIVLTETDRIMKEIDK